MRRAADENIHENIRLFGRLLCSHHKGRTLPFHVSQPFTVVVEYYNDYGDGDCYENDYGDDNGDDCYDNDDNDDCVDNGDGSDDDDDGCDDDGGNDWSALIAKVTSCPFESLCLSLFPLIENILRCQMSSLIFSLLLSTFLLFS